jgi:uncharacterized protein YdhG (YjbR/CyaY superfamily)
MASLPAATVDEYLAQLPPERRAVVSAVRAMVRKHLPKGYVERPAWGMITYSVPLEHTGPTYNGQPLCYAALAAQKSHYALYLMGAYMNPALTKRLQELFAAAGKKLDMGKSCVRFKSLDAIPLEGLGEVIAAVPVDTFVARAQAAHAATKTGAKKTAKKATQPATKAKGTTARATKASRKK